MKTSLLCLLLISCTLCISSCGYPPYPPGGGVGLGLGAGYYNTLPGGFNSPYYLHNNRYYYGGRYEPGRFHYNGQHYSGRYFHGGRYLYGGQHFEHHHH